MNTRALTQAVLAGLLKPALSEVNMINAPVVAKERGMKVSELRRDQQGVFEGYIRVGIVTQGQSRTVAGTVFSDGRPRIIQIKGINMDAEFRPLMLYVTNTDKPGFIGRLGTLLGNAGINIASFAFGRVSDGGDAIGLVAVDTPVPDSVLGEIRNMPNVHQAKRLAF